MKSMERVRIGSPVRITFKRSEPRASARADVPSILDGRPGSPRGACSFGALARWDIGVAGRHLFVLFLGLMLAPLLPGCPGTIGNGGNGDVLDGNVDTTLTSPLGKTSGEPNGSFDDPIAAVIDAFGGAQVQGTIASSDDMDVFLLGAIDAGTRVIIDVSSVGSPLDASVALFDAEGRLAFEDDDRGGDSRELDPLIDFVTRRGSEAYYVVIARSAFASSGTRTGTYGIDITLIPDQTVPTPIPQTLVLDFDGGEVDSPVLGRMTLEPFNATDVSPIYAGETDVMRDAVMETFFQNYERFNVTILTSDDPEPDQPYSVIFFGGFNPTAFGLAENVDLYNIDRCDDAIIFTKTFSPSAFQFEPSALEMGVAIGNIAAHEAGHLLGLNHVTDDLDLMDDQSAADAFLLDQEFIDSPLSSDIIRIGSQDGALLLFETVGPKP